MRKLISILLPLAVMVLGGCVREEISVTDGRRPEKEEEKELLNPALAWSASSFVATFGEEASFPTLTNKYEVPVSFASSHPEVAAIAEDGTITLVAGGTTTITASSVETDTYQASSCAYTLTVLQADGALAWSDESATAVLGAQNVFPLLSNPHELTVSYFSSEESVAAIDEEGTITLVGAGVTTIVAASEENGQYSASSVSYILTVAKATGVLTWSAEQATATFGVDNTFPVLSNPASLAVNYLSSEESVATIDEEGIVTLVGAGVTTIIAEAPESDIFEAASASYTLTVNKSADGISWSETTCTVTIGADDNVFPVLLNPGDQTVQYSSGNLQVATIDEDGNITLLSAGSTAIIAASEATPVYAEASVYYTLTVLNPVIPQEEAGLAWSESNCSAVMGSMPDWPTLVNPHDLAVHYTSSDPEVATIDADGIVTMVGAGSTVITASSDETEQYLAGSASYTLTLTRAQADLAWSKSAYTASLDSSNHFPTLTNPHDLAVSYTSSDESVAAISPDGTITLLAAGSTTIVASSPETRVYASGSASYTLTVVKRGVTLRWSSTSFTATLEAENRFPTLAVSPADLPITYASSNPAVATISQTGEVTLVSAGTSTISASFAGDDTYESASASYTLKVVKNDVSLSWSASTCEQVLEAENAGAYPVLTVDPGSLSASISYSSSDASVATISSTGTVKLKGTGTTTIKASFAGNASYNAASASYTLKVKTNADDGSGTWNYPSTGDSTSEDDVCNTTFTRMVTVTYSSAGATVSGYSASPDITVSISGNGVTINNTGTENVVYKLSGTASDGYFKLYSTKKMALLMEGVSLTNPAGAAINIQSGKRCFVMVEGTNTLADGSSAAYSSGTEDMKAVFFSEGQLCISGSGSLEVTASNAQGKSGIASDDYVRLMKNPIVTVTAGSSAGHGVSVNEYVQISNGKLTISTSAAKKKGISSDDYVLVEGGTTSITVSGGVAYDSEDKEYKGSAGIKADNYFGMTAGSVTIKNTGKGGKGISAGSYDYDSAKHTLSDSYISGGTLSITCTGSESNDVSAKGMKVGWATKSGSGEHATVTGSAGKLIISGGTVNVTASGGEGIEAKGTLTVSGGTVYGYSGYDDGINCVGDMTISGGYVCAWTAGSKTGADGFDANGNLYVKGGVAYGVCQHGSPDVAFDANTEGGKKLYVQGGTLIAVGGLESGASITGSAYKASSWSKNTWYGLWNSSSSAVIAFKTPSNGNSLVVYSNGNSVTLKSDVSYSGTTIFGGNAVIPGSIDGGSSVSLSTYTGGGGGPGPGPGPGPGW